MKRTPVLIDVNGVPLRESLSYNGGGAGFGGQMAEWLPPAQSADAALLPALRLGNARADDLVRNNGIAANAVALHKDHIVGHMFLISYRPNWRWLGMRETAAKSFVDEVEAAWSEYAEGMSGEIDVEEKRTFTEFIREGVGVHAFNGEIFVQPVWDTESTQLFRTFRAGGGRADPWGQSVLQRNGTAEDARFPAGNTASVGHSEGDVCSDD
ncbi:phage portal protein [Escherichia coli]|nr:phage portal protein [Escherichia coli]